MIKSRTLQLTIVKPTIIIAMESSVKAKHATTAIRTKGFGRLEDLDLLWTMCFHQTIFSVVRSIENPFVVLQKLKKVAGSPRPCAGSA
jgi:hypothetical protein